MLRKLILESLVKFVLGIFSVGLLVFLPAGTFSYPAGWKLMAVVFIPMLIAGIIMLIKNPDLLKMRLKAKEEEGEQKVLVCISALMFTVGFVVAGLNFRFGWYALPKAVSDIAAIVYVIGYCVYGEVLRENQYLSRTIEIQSDHKVIDTGLYAVVRHPMYSATLILFLAIPLILGSIYSFYIFMIYPFIIARRIKMEEELLVKELFGYSEYKEKVKYRLIPFVW